MQSYAADLAAGDYPAAFRALSTESKAYYPDPASLGSDRASERLGGMLAGGQLTWSKRPAWEETHRSETAVTAFGTASDGTWFAAAWGVRKVDGRWVIDQDRLETGTDEARIVFLPRSGPVDPGEPILFALTELPGVTNVAVTASIGDSPDFLRLTESTRDGQVRYAVPALADLGLRPGEHSVTVSWVAEDQPFVHVHAGVFSIQP